MVVGANLTIYRGDTWHVTIDGLGDITQREKLWFTVKWSLSQTDEEAVIQIEETDGLLRLNGGLGVAGDGTLVVDDELSGAVSVTLSAKATALLQPAIGLSYDIQMRTDDGVTTLTAGALSVVADVTRKI